MSHWIAAVSLAAFALVAFDDIRLRRRLRIEWMAQDAERRLGGGGVRVDDIELPHPNDSRWVCTEVDYVASGGYTVKEQVLKMGAVDVIIHDGRVHVGPGKHLPNSSRYGKAVIRAYRQRLSDAARKPTP